MSQDLLNQNAADRHQAALTRAREWAVGRTYAAADYPIDRLAGLAAGRGVSVVIPCKQTGDTIGRIVEECVALVKAGVVEQVIVIDAASTDKTAAIAQHAGAEVFQEAELLGQFGPVLGKGDALWRSLSVATGEIVVYVDGDSIGFSREFVTGLAGPLLANDTLQLVKGSFRRPFIGGGERVEDGGGRVTELAARPLLNVYFPELTAVNQPLSGEIAGRRAALAGIPYFTGYGSEIQMMIDFYRHFGLDAIAQTDLGERINRHQPLQDLGTMAFAVMRAILSRVPGADPDPVEFARYLGYRGGILREGEARLVERPPLETVDGA